MQHSLTHCCPKNGCNKILHFCSRRSLYFIFATLRILLNFVPQTGYIHPDEFFQFIEVASGDAFDIDVYKPWEFNITFPVRSSLFPQLCVRLPYFILEALTPYSEYFFGISLKTPYFLVLFPRLMMTILSFVSDYCLFKICIIFREPYVDRLTIFASSYVILIYSCRTFSNSIEIILTSILIYHVSRCIEFSNKVVLQSDYLADKYYKARTGVERAKIYKLRMSLPPHSLNYCLLLATITVFGIFNRPTFIAFAFPPIFFWLHRGLGSKTVGFLDFHIRIFVFVIFSIPTVIILILYDSLYFGYLTMAEVGKFEISMNNFVVTPLNFLKYNSITDNLKNHGLHPRFLHFLVNVPLLFNVLGVIAVLTIVKMVNSGLRGRWLELPRIQNIESLMVSSFAVPIALLSIFPHQEPRFILPVILPLIFLFSHYIKCPEIGAVNVANKKKPMPSKLVKENKFGLKGVWYLCNAILVIFYGFVHQGGVLPLTSHLFKELKAKPYLMHIHLFTSHTYPVPTGILHLRNTKRTYTSDSGHKYTLTKDFNIYELGSKTVDTIYDRISSTIEECEKDLHFKRVPYRLYYALPYSLYNEFADYVLNNETQSFKFNLVKSFYPHVSMEKLPELAASWDCLNMNILQDCSLNFIDNVSENILNYLRQFTLVLLQIEYKNKR
ncbi:hypothetical protein TSAR_003180 [Trichomalopsis sarcophagae]|uniref:Mannosyltransferase n=1 Tax=Trichomalopsis sarcophagae TaxID=543379 RepID=A0A232EY41_9HYME|nr:hypothetical protein TSAR_003180 [Trichomalopsis sarcophagae]